MQKLSTDLRLESNTENRRLISQICGTAGIDGELVMSVVGKWPKILLFIRWAIFLDFGLLQIKRSIQSAPGSYS